MKNYKKIRAVSFLVSVAVLAGFAAAFSLCAKLPEQGSEPQTKAPENIQSEQSLPEDYTNYSDNVSGVSFTEDQITELVRNVYFKDGFVSGINVDFTSDGEIFIEGKIKDADNLCENYPELAPFESVFKSVENKKISITGAITDNNGMADYKILSASVGNLKLTENILVPFMQEGTFSDLFNVSFDSIEIFNDSVIFKDELPSVLQY